MPKEVFRSAVNGTDEPTLELSWGRDQEYVQAATLMPSERVRTDQMMGILIALSERPEFRHMLAGRDTLALAKAIAEEQVHAGWYIQLQRHSINRLIRALRRARDQAFGADA